MRACPPRRPRLESGAVSSKKRELSVLAVEGFFGASHQAFLEGLVAASRHRWELVALPARRWKERMCSGAEALAEKAAGLEGDFDALFATDMVDLAALATLLPARLGELPRVLYFHENQLTYPTRYAPEDHWQFGLINATSALAADRVLFNSRFHRDDFLAAIPAFLQRLPAGARLPADAAGRIASRSAVVHPGIDVAGIPCPERSAEAGPLRILWNHRWEFDKRPEAFFAALEKLKADFRVVVCGESFARKPGAFERAPELLGERLEHFGYAERREDYLSLLGRADVIVSTAAQEFFGIAWLEACAAGCMPLLPRRLSYPELLPGELHAECLYADDDELAARLAGLAAEPERARRGSWRAIAEPFAWPKQAALMDSLLEEIAG